MKSKIISTSLLDFADSKNIIRDARVFDLKYVPRRFYIRREMKDVADAIKMFIKYDLPQHIHIAGKPGSGKTASIKYLQREAEEKGHDLNFVYVSGRECNTKFKVMAKICGYDRRTDPNKVYSEFFDKMKGKNVVVIDEADVIPQRHLDDICFMFSRWGEAVEVPDGSLVQLILISCDVQLIYKLDASVRSSLSPKYIFYGAYKKEDIYQILSLRAEEGLYDGSYDDSLLEELAEICANDYRGDARYAILALRELAVLSEYQGLEKIDGNYEWAFRKAGENIMNQTLYGLNPHELAIMYTVCKLPEDERYVKNIMGAYIETCALFGLTPLKKSEFYSTIEELRKMNIIMTVGGGGRKGGRGRTPMQIVPLIDEYVAVKLAEKILSSSVG